MYLKERVVENILIGNPAQRIYRLVLKGHIAKEAKPGQFVHIQVSGTQDPLLRRPLSIAGIEQEKEELTIYYRVAGRGTELLSRINADEYLSVLGPLGTGFNIPERGELLLIAGGIGVFPLYSLIQAVQQTEVRYKLLWGGESLAFMESAGINYLKRIGADFETSTLDGSSGYHGLVTDLLNQYIAKIFSQGRQADSLTAAACGPKGMLEAVAEICLQNGISLEVSLEERMACGVGACLGCVCTVKDQEGGIKRKRVCKEGPVLKAKEVVWDEKSI